MAAKAGSAQTADKEMQARLVESAQAKLAGGQDPTKRETAALRRWIAAQAAGELAALLSSCPKHVYLQISGRDAKTLHEQADRYGLPLRGAPIDLAAVVRAFHDLLAARSAAAGNSQTDLPWGDSTGSPALERWREVRAKREQIKLDSETERALDREQVHEVWQRMASHLRGLGETYARQYGPDALELLNETLGDCAREMTRLGMAQPVGGKNGKRKRTKRKTKAKAKAKKKPAAKPAQDQPGPGGAD